VRQQRAASLEFRSIAEIAFQIPLLGSPHCAVDNFDSNKVLRSRIALKFGIGSNVLEPLVVRCGACTQPTTHSSDFLCAARSPDLPHNNHKMILNEQVKQIGSEKRERTSEKTLASDLNERNVMTGGM
jgi:hypothetical protein